MPFITLTHCPVCGNSDIHEVYHVEDHFSSGEVFPLFDCSDCGLRFTNHFPPEEEIGTYYDSPDYISHTDTREGVMNRVYHAARELMLKRKVTLVQKHAPRSTGRLLDMGCGTGYFLNAAKKRGFQVTGIEKDPRAREFARERFGLNVADEKHFWEVKKGSFHAVTLWHVLEHVEQLNETIARLKHMLTDDGTLVIAVPNHGSHDHSFYRQYWAAYDVPRHLWHFSPRSLEHLLTKHELNIVHKYPMPLDAYYISFLSEKYKKSAGLTAFARPLFIGTAGFLRSCGNPDHSSSIIYVAKKRE